MHYKRHHPQDSKDVNWSTPIEYQHGYDIPEEPFNPPSKKPKDYCIKLKKEHEYDILKETYPDGIVTPPAKTLQVWACRGCGKKKWEYK